MTKETVVNLDNRISILDIDKNDMLGTLEKLPDQIKAAREIPTADLGNFTPNKVAVLGMGGSAIAGDIIEAWLHKVLEIPVLTVRGYEIPAAIDSNTLVFAISFSGNTEETISAFKEAAARKARIIAISTGGELAGLAEANEVPHILIDLKEPLVPRAAVAYLLIPVIKNMTEAGLIPSDEVEAELNDLVTTIETLRTTLQGESPTVDNQAKQIAQKLTGYIPTIYSYRPFSCISYRWRTQLNENSKILARNAEIPEMNHNDIVGWSNDDDPERYCVVLLRDLELESKRMEKRIELTKDLAFSRSKELIEVYAAGKYLLSKMLSLMYIGDFTSVYMAVLRGVDPTPVDMIEQLKKLMQE